MPGRFLEDRMMNDELGIRDEVLGIRNRARMAEARAVRRKRGIHAGGTRMYSMANMDGY